jgi:acyl carrier protein
MTGGNKDRMEELIPRLEAQIIRQLNLRDISPGGIDPDEPLFRGRLGLDSIDSLEFIILLEKNYGLRIKDPAEGKKVLHSLSTMAEYIIANGRG